MGELSKNLLDNKKSRSQFLWVIFIRVIGIVMILAPLYLPFIAYFKESKANVVMTTQDWFLICFGILLSSGGKQIGVVVNNIGIIFQAFLNKMVK